MDLSIKDPRADKLVRSLAKLTGETLTEAIVNSLEERLYREQRKHGNIGEKVQEINEMVKRFNQRPILNNRTPDEIIGYDEHGLPR